MNRNEYMRIYQQNYRHIFPEKNKRFQMNGNRNRRMKALQRVNSELTCEMCGESDLKELTIHHKNHDGSTDRVLFMGALFYNAIVTGKRKTSDLQILCVKCQLYEHFRFMDCPNTILRN